MTSENKNLMDELIEKNGKLVTVVPFADNFLIANYQFQAYGSSMLEVTAQMVNLTNSAQTIDTLYLGFAIYDGLNGSGNILLDRLNGTNAYPHQVSTFSIPALTVVTIPKTLARWNDYYFPTMKSVKVGYLLRSTNTFFTLATFNY